MKTDIIFLSHNRREFTQIALPELFKNTNPNFVGRIHVIDDGSSDGSREFLKRACEKERRVPVTLHFKTFGAVVPMMNFGISMCTQPFIAKIDNDTVVPPGWLEACVSVVTRHPELVLLGIDNKNPVQKLPPNEYIFTPTRNIGGIGIFRRAFFNIPIPMNPNAKKRKYCGFTEFQWSRPNAIKGWINPGLEVILLDRVPLPEFDALIKKYRANGWQRGCGHYPKSMNHWKWKFPNEA